MLKTIIVAASLFFIAGTALSLLRLTDWWVRAFDFPRPQIAVSGLVLWLLYVFFWDLRRPWEGLLVAALLAAVLYQGWRIWPYTPLAREEVKMITGAAEENVVSILVSNVYMENRDASKLLAEVRRLDPDVLLTVETDEWWEEQLRPLEEVYPHHLKKALPNTYGMLLYSRLELIGPEIEFLVKDDIPSMHAHVRLPSGRTFQLHALHPRPPSPTEAPDALERDAELLIVARRVEKEQGPTIVTGDLNDVAWSSTTSLMQRVSGLLDPRVGRGLYSTFHAKIPILRWPLDHVFHSDHFKLVELKRLPEVGSDHFPIYIRLALTAEAPVEQQAPPREPEDEERVEETLQEAFSGEGPAEVPPPPEVTEPPGGQRPRVSP